MPLSWQTKWPTLFICIYSGLGFFFFKTFILGNFSDRRYRLDYKNVIKRYFMKTIGIGPGVYIGRGGGPVLKHLCTKISFSSFGIRRSPSFQQTEILVIHECILTIKAEISTVILEKNIFIFCQNNFPYHIPSLILSSKRKCPAFKHLSSCHLFRWFLPSLIKIGPMILE